MAIQPTKGDLLKIDELASRRLYDDKKGRYRPQPKPADIYKSFLGDIFSRVRGLQRSASLTSLTYEHDQHAMDSMLPPRSPSYSSLAPSQALSLEDRFSRMMVHGCRYQAYRPHQSQFNPEARPDYHVSLHKKRHKIWEPLHRNGISYARERYNSNFPTDWSRFDRLVGYESGMVQGHAKVLALTYPTYDPRHDREYMRYMTCRSLIGPYYGRRQVGEREVYRPYRLTLVYPCRWG